jgi:2-oxopent-4-enoate/cis-2-oxohex-4-enoate hydratase
MDKEEIGRLGDELYSALRGCHTVAPLTERLSAIAIDDAYRVSQAMLARRVDGDGERVVGKKIGVTSQAVQDMLGVYQPDFGFLTDAMARDNDAAITIAGSLIQPRAEGEIAFRLRSRLEGPGVTEADVLAATECVLPCFEIVDSRIEDWRIRIEDTVADNASCGLFVLGDGAADPRGLDLPSLHMRLYKNGEFACEGRGSAVQGNPLTAVAWLANTLGALGTALEPGEVILSGSLSPLLPAAPGDHFSLEIEGLGSASCSFR